MRKKTIYSIISFASVLAASCTDNQRARSFGGEQEIKLDPCRRLVNLTWKEAGLLILTRANSGEQVESYVFDEKSDLGIPEGRLVIHEQACEGLK